MCSLSIISDDIGGEITRLRLVGVSNVGSARASCPRRSAKTAIPGAVPVIFRGRFLVRQIIHDDSEATFSLCQMRFSVRCVVYNHNKPTASANKCCRKVKPSVNSSGNKSSILHILQMESSRWK